MPAAKAGFLDAFFVGLKARAPTENLSSEATLPPSTFQARPRLPPGSFKS
jgi:hypothetical protein